MSTHTILPNPGILKLDSMAFEGDVIVLCACTFREEVPCPLCHHASDRIHSHYRRTLWDLPWQGTAVRFEVQSRKFFCDNRDCSRRIFTEPLPNVAERYGRRTCRLADALRELCYLVGGEAAMRIARTFGLLLSADSLLRHLKKCSASAGSIAQTPRVLGMDDFAFRRGHTYGTILIDLEKHTPVDLLPDRKASSVAAWLAAHPGVQVISRDRGAPYIEGATTGAPDAVQIADRWHLIKNMGDALERLIIRHGTALREAARTKLDSRPLASESTGNSKPKPVEPTNRPLTRHEQDQQHRRDRRFARYEEVRELYRQGLTLRAIGKKAGLDRRTVSKFVNSELFPEIAARPERQSKVAPFAEYLKRRWEEGCHNGALLWRELQALGYTGGQNAVDRFLHSHGLRAEAAGDQSNPRPTRPPAPRRVAWLLTNRGHPKAETEDLNLIQRLMDACPEICVASELGSEFCTLVRDRRAAELDNWLKSVSEKGPPELRRFATGLVADKSAVLAGLSLVWNNGQTEGQVNRLKFIKRQMYGRASFDLLKARVLPHRAA